MRGLCGRLVRRAHPPLPLRLRRLRGAAALLCLGGILCVAEKEGHLRAPDFRLPVLVLCKCSVVLFLLQNILLFYRIAALRRKRKQRAELQHSTPAVRPRRSEARPCFIVLYSAAKGAGLTAAQPRARNAKNRAQLCVLPFLRQIPAEPPEGGCGTNSISI